VSSRVRGRCSRHRRHAGGEEAGEAGKREMLAEDIGRRLHQAIYFDDGDITAIA
jgi:hypothetical protein